MELRAYVDILWRRKWVVLLTMVVTTIIAAVATYLATPIYVSSATLRVATIGTSAVDIGRPDISYTERLMNTYARIITSDSARGQIREQLGLNTMPEIVVEMIPDTELIKIKAEAPDPVVAREATSAAADLLISQSQDLYVGGGQTTEEILILQIAQMEEELSQTRDEYERLLRTSPSDTAAISATSQSIELKERTYAYLLQQYENVRVNEALRANAVLVVEEAFTPRNPAKPRHALNVVLGVLVGLTGGTGLALLLENLDTTLYTVEEIETTAQLSAVGRIPDATKRLSILHSENGFQPHLEAFRRLRTNILAANLDLKARTLLVTSAERGEGKSTIVANLAVVIAQSGRRVLVVDCDMRLPTLHKLFDLPNQRGLTNVLVRGMELSEVVNKSAYPRVGVVTSGPLPPNPSELLGAPQMAELIQQMKQEYDVVILDTPALLSVTDAAVLVPFADQVVLVVARAQTHKGEVRAAKRELMNVNAKSIGVVVNRAEPTGASPYSSQHS